MNHPDKKLITKYNQPIPRYTSYPPANHFISPFSEENYLTLVEQSNQGEPENIAFYVHIPFCKKICLYCGCNAYAMGNQELVDKYFEALKNEISIISKHIDKNRKVSQIHYGGGTPNAVDAKYLEEINSLFFGSFSFVEKPEIAIECHPAYLDFEYLQRLINAKFNRFSFGIQDFDARILKNVNRDAAALPVQSIVDFLRAASPEISVNLDFIYGLPGQSIDSFLKSIQQAIEIKPDRLVTFSYAHVPWVKKHQQILEKRGLLTAEQKMDIFLATRELMLQSGYVAIGLDHYVLPDDELSIALSNRQLHRNFQGYCTLKTTGQVYAFGVSAISQLSNGYSQNTKDLSNYINDLAQNHLPVEKGLIINDSQKIIRYIITEIMCNQSVNLMSVAGKFDVTLPQLKELCCFSTEKLDQLKSDELVNYADNQLTVTEKGSLFIRNIAVIFDPEYQPQQFSYSKTV